MQIKINKPYAENLSEEDWLNHRKQFITATESGALMGVHPYSTPSKLLKDKVLPPKKLVSDFLDRGLEHEEEVLNRAIEWLDGELLDSQGFYANPETRISATPDGILKDGRMIEIKTTGIKNFKKWKSPPEYYIMQAQVQMYVTGARENYIMVRFFYNWPQKECLGGADKMWKIKYDPKIIKILIDKVKDFWYAIDNGSTIRLKKEENEKHAKMLRKTCKEFKGNIIMQKFEIDPSQLKRVKQTCIKTAAKMMRSVGCLESFATESVNLAEIIEKEIFYDIGEACDNGGREFMIQIGALVNGFVDVYPTGSVKDLKHFVVEGLKYLHKQ